MKGFPSSIDADVAGLAVPDVAGDDGAGGAESPKKQPTLPSTVLTVSEATIQRLTGYTGEFALRSAFAAPRSLRE